jgi:hypothetical protein
VLLRIFLFKKDKESDALIATDLNGENMKTLAQGYRFSESWYSDGTKVAYIFNAMGSEGGYVIGKSYLHSLNIHLG